MIRHPRLLALLLLLAVAPLAPASEPVTADMAVGVSELCTTCNDVIRCERTAGDGPPIVVYNLLEDGFWAQIATIWDYLVQFISPKTEDIRDMTVYELTAAGSGPVTVNRGLEATVDAQARIIRVPGSQIDQRSGRWYSVSASGDETELGRCELLEFAAGREFITSLNARENTAP